MHFDHTQRHALHKGLKCVCVCVCVCSVSLQPVRLNIPKLKHALSPGLNTQRNYRFHEDDYNNTDRCKKEKGHSPVAKQFCSLFFFGSFPSSSSDHVCILSSLVSLSHPSHSLFCFTYPFVTHTPLYRPRETRDTTYCACISDFLRPAQRYRYSM